MYKNPLNNGDLSDYNSLKNQRNYGARVKRYEKVKLKIEPTELQKYYQYLTYQQPILDELNYVAEKLKNEDIKKQKENFEFIEKLKEDRETKLKDLSITEKDLTNELRNELFDSPIISNDITPTIKTDLELEIIDIPKNEREINEEKSAIKIEKAILNKIKRERAKKVVETEKKIKNINNVMLKVMENKKDEIDKAFENIREQTLKEQASNLLKASIKRTQVQPIYKKGVEYQKELALQADKDLQKQENKDFFKLTKGEPEISRRGRPKGSKNKK